MLSGLMTRGYTTTDKQSPFGIADRPFLSVAQKFPLESRDGSPQGTRCVDALLRGTKVPLFFFSCKCIALSRACAALAPAQTARTMPIPCDDAGRRSGPAFNTLFPNRYIQQRQAHRTTKNQELLPPDSAGAVDADNFGTHLDYCFSDCSTSIGPALKRGSLLPRLKQQLRADVAALFSGVISGHHSR